MALVLSSLFINSKTSFSWIFLNENVLSVGLIKDSGSLSTFGISLANLSPILVKWVLNTSAISLAEVIL